MKILKKILFLPLLALASINMNAQLFNKANPGYIVYKKGGEKKEGFVKTKVTSQTEGIISLYFSETQDGKNQVVKTKELSEFKLNDVTYLRKKIKVSLIKSSEMLCPAFYISDRIQGVFNPEDVNDRNLPSTYFVDKESYSEPIGNFSSTELHIFKDGKYTKLTPLSYGKDMKSIFGDNPKWMEKAGEKGWLKYENVVENINFYEQQ